MISNDQKTLHNLTKKTASEQKSLLKLFAKINNSIAIFKVIFPAFVGFRPKKGLGRDETRHPTWRTRAGAGRARL